MKPITLYANSACVVYEKAHGYYCVRLRAPSGELHDKVRCDSYREAQAYHRAFKAIAKAMR